MALAYAVILTLCWYRCSKFLGIFDMARPFRWCLLRGVFCGALFGVLVLTPARVTDVVIEAQRIQAKGLVLVLQLLDQAEFTAVILLVFMLIGGLAGGALGLSVPRHKAT